MGLLVMISGIAMSKSLEADSEALVHLPFIQRTKLNAKSVCKGLKRKELWQSVLFVMILGSVIPTFGTFFYYFETDELGVTQVLIATLAFTGYVAMVIGVNIYNMCLTKIHIQYMMISACVLNIFGAILTYMIVQGWTFGLKP